MEYTMKDLQQTFAFLPEESRPPEAACTKMIIPFVRMKNETHTIRRACTQFDVMSSCCLFGFEVGSERSTRSDRRPAISSKLYVALATIAISMQSYDSRNIE